MAVAPEIESPLDYDLTPEAIEARDNDIPMLIAGDEIDWRFQALDDDGEPQSLSGAVIVFTLKQFEEDTSPLLQRRSDTSSGGEVQAEADADQSAEDVDADGNPTGKGWLTIRWRTEDESALITAAATARVYDLRIKFAGNSPLCLLRGAIRIVVPIGRSADL